MLTRRECEFYLLRYVPDPVRDEFVHVGVILRDQAAGREAPGRGAAAGPEAGGSKIEAGGFKIEAGGSKIEAGGAMIEGRAAPKLGARLALKFTSDWRRVRCLDPGADIVMLEGLESELRRRFQDEPEGNLMHVLEDSFSNSVQVTRAKGYLAESVESGVEELMRMYVEPPRRERVSRLSGRAAIQQEMRSEFEQAGVWDLLRKRIQAAEYTRAGDPLRIDLGYRPNGVIRMFQAVSLDPGGSAGGGIGQAGVEMAKSLAFSANSLMAGVQRVERASLELTAIVEPWRGARQGARQGARLGTGNGEQQGTGDRSRKMGNLRSRAGDGIGEEEAGGAGGWAAGDGAGENSEAFESYRFAVETMEEYRIRVLTTADLGRVAETARRELRV